MGRHEQREHLFKLLFRVEFNSPEEMPEQMKLFFDDGETVLTEKEEDYISGKFLKIQEKLPELDSVIEKNTDGWTVARIGKVELTVLRLAAYEILFDSDIPAGVAVDEAVEIAKTYGQETSGGFVNAILSKVVKQGE